MYNTEKIKELKAITGNVHDRTSIHMSKDLRNILKVMSSLNDDIIAGYIAKLVQQDIYNNAYQLGNHKQLFDYLMTGADEVVDQYEGKMEEVKAIRQHNASVARKGRVKLYKEIRREREKMEGKIQISARQKLHIGKQTLEKLKELQKQERQERQERQNKAE